METDDQLIGAPLPRIAGTHHTFSLRVSERPPGRCVVCGGEGATLPTECPGQEMGPEMKEMVRAGLADFRRAAWVATLL